MMTTASDNQTPIKIAILLLNYNGLKYLPLFFKHAEFLRNHPEAELVFIDNASIDDSLTWMSTNANWVQLIRNQENYGFSEGYNQGIKTLQAAGKTFTHYMFLNNDVIVSPEWLNEIIKAIKSSDARVAEFGCRSVFMAPYIRENILSTNSRQWAHLRCHLATYPSSSHFYFDCNNKTLEVAAKIFRDKLPEFARETLHSQPAGYYQLELSTNSLSPIDIQLAAGFTAHADDYQDISSVITIWKSTPPSESIKLRITPGKLVKIRRIITEQELAELPPLIQNSGIGVNSAFEGFDLHCFAPASVAQDHKATRGICGVCKTVRADVFHELGGFDKNIFMYYEDLDLSLRLQERGYKSRLVESSILIHDHSGTSNNHSAFFTRQVAWSLFYFHWRHGSFLRRLKTWLRYFLLARGERGSSVNPMTRFHELALSKFRSISNSHYLRSGGVS